MSQIAHPQIAIVLYPGYTALDLIGPYEVLRMLPKAQIRFVWHEPGPVVADSGVLLIGATHTFEETPSPDIVLVPGGPGFAEAARDKELRRWLQNVHATTTWTASVCTGSIILAAAGLLEQRPATSHWAGISALKLHGALPVTDQRIVPAGEDSRIVTAAGVSAGIDAALWLAEQLAGPERAEAIALAIEYDPRPPVRVGPVESAPGKVKTTATMLANRDGFRPGVVTAATALAWQGAVGRVRARRERARR